MLFHRYSKTNILSTKSVLLHNLLMKHRSNGVLHVELLKLLDVITKHWNKERRVALHVEPPTGREHSRNVQTERWKKVMNYKVLTSNKLVLQ